MCVCVCVCVFATPWTLACQAPLSMGFSRRRLPFFSPGDLPDSGTDPGSPIWRQILYYLGPGTLVPKTLSK